MIAIVRRRLAAWQFAKLEKLIHFLRAWMAAAGSQSAGSMLAKEHINIADEHFAEAAAALSYNKFDQSLYACRKGLLQAGTAQILIKYGATLESGMSKLATLTKASRFSEEHELVLYLASSLAQMKTVIEYSNCTVSTRAQQFLDSAMDYYNDAMAGIKKEDLVAATRAAQAGLLQLSLASRIIRFDNELLCLPSLRGITNPMLASPLRRLDEMIVAIATVRSEIARATPEMVAIIRPHYERSLKAYDEAIHALAKNDVPKAQTRIARGLDELETAHGLIGSSGYADISLTLPLATVSQALTWTPLVHVEPALSDIASFVPLIPQRKQEQARNYVNSIGQTYAQAVKHYDSGNLVQALDAATKALLELDLLRSICATAGALDDSVKN